MLIILILALLLIVVGTPTLGICIAFRYCDETKQKKIAKKVLIIITLVIMVIFIIMSMIAIVLSAEKNSYDVLEQRYEIIQETYKLYRTHTRMDGGEWLSEVYSYNNKVMQLKARANNQWTNWFVNKKRTDKLKLVEFEDGFLKQGE